MAKVQFIISMGEFSQLGPDQVAIYEAVRAQYEGKGHEILDLPPQECSGVERLEVSLVFRVGSTLVSSFTPPSQGPDDQNPLSQFNLIYGLALPDLAPGA